MTETKNQQANLRAHTVAACIWIGSTLALVAFSLVHLVGGRPQEVGGFPWLVAILALAFSAYLGTGLRVRFVIGHDREAVPLRRLAGAACGLVFVLVFPSTFGAMRLSGSAGLYDLWREHMPTPLGLGLSVVAAVGGGLFLWESVVALGEVTGARASRARLLASLLLVGWTLATVAGLSEMVVGRSYFEGDS